MQVNDRARAASGVVEGPVQRHFLGKPITLDMGHGRIESAKGRSGGRHEDPGPPEGQEAGEGVVSALP